MRYAEEVGGGAGRWAARLFGALDGRDLEALGRLLADDVCVRVGNGPAIHCRGAAVDATRGLPAAVASTRHAFTPCVGVDAGPVLGPGPGAV